MRSSRPHLRRWTPELRVEQEALGIVRFLFDYKRLSKPKAIASIKADQTITEAVRAKALELAQQFGEPARE